MRSALVPPLTTPMGAPAATLQARRELEKVNLQLASGRYADMGLELGGRSDVLVEARAQFALLEGLIDDAAISASRLQTVQLSLKTMVDGAQDLLDGLMPLKTGQMDPSVAAGQAAGNFAAMIAAVNTTSQGSYVFGGQNVGVAPLADYFADPPPPARVAVESAFIARFGFAPGDPAAAGITADQMADFIDNDLAPLFDDPAWGSDWSQATDEPMRTLVSLNDVVSVTASANDPAIRKLAMAYVMVAGLGIETMGEAARNVIADRAIATIGEAVAGLNETRGVVGVQEKRVADARDRLEIQKGWVEREIAGMEQVDLHEMAMRVNELQTRLEAAYTVSGRLQELTLLRYM
ncbi:MAG TPA: flagellar hook-associated family protein [Thermopetrobacter sp.]|nr:flagellar hook-associated family protein [Thermopetrobacter sp.]